MAFNFPHLQLITLVLVLLQCNIQSSCARRSLLRENKPPTRHFVTEFSPLFQNPNFVPNNPLLPTLPPIPTFPTPIGGFLNPPTFSLPPLPPLPKLPHLPSLPIFRPGIPSTMPSFPRTPSRSSSPLGLAHSIPHGENANP
ncbi:hypothetical protein Fmac_020923 [Flemingia macrophylla]|uniref:Uncharacterized protein n=1 Tax=Flemingia macrophylla TaxID=520843 RepID=A0ABD1LVF3_9FABA